MSVTVVVAWGISIHGMYSGSCMVALVLILMTCHDVGDLYTWNYGIIVLILNAVAGMRDLYTRNIFWKLYGGASLNDCCHGVGDLYTWNYGIIVLILNAVAGMGDLYMQNVFWELYQVVLVSILIECCHGMGDIVGAVWQY